MHQRRRATLVPDGEVALREVSLYESRVPLADRLEKFFAGTESRRWKKKHERYGDDSG
jgi:hypothetical protein